jgi:hypothetical protein
MLGVLRFKVQLQSTREVLDLFLTSQEDQNATWRQLAMDFGHFFKRSLLVVFFSCLSEDRRHRELSSLNIDAVRPARQVLREKTPVISEIFNSQGGRHNDKPQWVMLELAVLTSLDLRLLGLTLLQAHFGAGMRNSRQ